MGQAAGSVHDHRFAIFAWLALAYDVGVILWGAVVRATGSGAGCGDHWPLCGGQLIPHVAQVATLIEFSHRVSSGLAVVLAVALAYFAFRGFPSGHPTRRYAVAALFFTLMEGLIGAALVLFGWVGKNTSMTRVAVLSLHQVNTFLLLAFLALTAKSAGLERTTADAGLGSLPQSSGLFAAYAGGLVGTLALAITGTIAALADSLFHPASLSQGLNWDFSSSAPSELLQLRIIHPALAVFVGGFLAVLAAHVLISPAPGSAKRAARWLLGLVVLQFFFGVLNVVLLAPVWMQMLHLLTADLIWITLVLLAAAHLGWGTTRLPAWFAKPVLFPSSHKTVRLTSK